MVSRTLVNRPVVLLAAHLGGLGDQDVDLVLQVGVRGGHIGQLVAGGVKIALGGVDFFQKAFVAGGDETAHRVLLLDQIAERRARQVAGVRFALPDGDRGLNRIDINQDDGERHQHHGHHPGEADGEFPFQLEISKSHQSAPVYRFIGASGSTSALDLGFLGSSPINRINH